MISRYCQQGDIDGATHILEFMREKQLPVNENVFNALIMGHSNADDIESAAGILGVMTQAGLEPSADTYTTLLCGFARKGDVDSISKYIELCEQKEIHLLDKDYLEVVYALAVNGHEDKIDAVLSKLSKSVGYNQDAVNIILRLVNKGKVNTAVTILKTMPRSTRMDGELNDTGSFLIRQLVKADRSTEIILSVCSELESTSMHAKPVFVALEEALKEGKNQVARNLLLELKKKGSEIRQHYFWPLIATAKNQDEAFEVVNFMVNEFKQELSGQTIRDYIIPKLSDQNYDKQVATLRNYGVSPATACTCVAYSAIKKDDLAGAARIMNTFDAYFSPALFRKPLLFALTSKRDFDNYIKCVRSVHDGVPRLQNLNSNQIKEVEDENSEGGVQEDTAADSSRTDKLQADIVGSFVVDAVMNIRQQKIEALQTILEGLVAQGLSISGQKAEIIQNRIGEQMTNEISGLLAKLTSGELEPVQYEKRQTKFTSSKLQPDALERLITKLDEKGENTKGMKKQLLIQSIRSRDLEKTEKLIEKLKQEGYTLTNGVYALLMELYASNNKSDEAFKIYNQIKSEDKEFELDDIKMIKLIQALVNNDKTDEAIKFLEANKKPDAPDSNNFQYNIQCWRMLNTLAEKGDKDNLNKLFEALTSNNYAAPTNVILGPLIKVHVMRDEVNQALDKFEEICQKYRATPWKNELACKLIQSEDAANLQRVTDLSTEIHGEVNSLYDLVFSFIECGRIRQARKILETPGLRARNYNRFGTVCERYADEGKPTILEGLVEATKDLNHIDRSEIYSNLVQTYIKDKSVDKCLELWTKMQEEDITASDALMIKLGNFLKSEGAQVPFVMPEVAEKNAPKQPKPLAPKKQEQPEKQRETAPKAANDPVSKLKSDIRSRNEEGIEAFISNPENMKLFGSLTISEKSKVIEATIKAGRLDEASKLVLDMLKEKSHPRVNVFRFFLNKLATNGDVETMEKIGTYLDDEMKKELSFDNRFCHGYVSQGKAEDYLKRLENAIDSAKTPEEIQKAGEVFPRGKLLF